MVIIFDSQWKDLLQFIFVRVNFISIQEFYADSWDELDQFQYALGKRIA